MNDCKFSGRPTRDPEIRYTEGAQPMAVARYTLAVDRKYKKEGGQQADFLSIVAFGKTAEFVEKYIKKGIKVIVECHAQSGSYTDKNGNKVYYTEFVADAHEFCESKRNNNDNAGGQQVDSDGFMNIPDGVAEELPFN
jgi:single-strand DNA-binding protein